MSTEATPIPAPEHMDTDAATDWIMGHLDAEEAQPAPESTPETPTEAVAEPDTPSEPEPQPETPRYRVKVRGEEHEVTLDELLHGYSRTEDYKAKTAEVAEARRAAQREAEQAQAERNRYLESLNQTLAFARDMDPVLAEGQRTDWAKLAAEDPAEYVQKWAQYQSRMGRVQQMFEEQARLQQEQMRGYLAEQERLLAEKVPEWTQPESKQKLGRQVGDYLREIGFSPEEIGGMADHRLLVVALDAARYREQQRQQRAIETKKVMPAPTKVQTPNAATDGKPDPKRNTQRLQQAKRSGRLDDQVDALLAALED